VSSFWANYFDEETIMKTAYALEQEKKGLGETILPQLLQSLFLNEISPIFRIQ